MLTMRSSTNHRYSRYGVTVSARMVLSKHNHANGDHNHANHALLKAKRSAGFENVSSTTHGLHGYVGHNPQNSGIRGSLPWDLKTHTP